MVTVEVGVVVTVDGCVLDGVDVAVLVSVDVAVLVPVDVGVVAMQLSQSVLQSSVMLNSMLRNVINVPHMSEPTSKQSTGSGLP